MTFPIKDKDPSAVLDYLFDFAALTNGNGSNDYLGVGETILTKTIVADAGITVDSSAIVNTSTGVQVWLSGGTDGATYNVTCRITTSGSRTDDRTLKIRVLPT